MKIGLIRHFKVDIRSPRSCNSNDYQSAIDRYNTGEILIPGSITDVTDYTVCYAASMKRARDTAGHLFPGEIFIRDDLVEIPIRAAFGTKLKLPFKAWNILNRVSWLFNSKRAPETRTRSNKRAVAFLREVLAAHEENTDILVVSHGLFMVSLQIQLSRMGFKGREFFRAAHGELYEFKNKAG
ncbi:MAG: histidine phosphatase family protein [bacterium]|nr:histidine phosphatase family protein [bacterium]